jgi:hypothetical protein
MIILPSRKIVIPSEPVFAGHSRFAGYYKLTVRNSEGHITRETPWFQNLITNNGLDLIWTSLAPSFSVKVLAPECYVGTGNAAPAFTDTTLQSYLATGSSISLSAATYVAGVAPYWKQSKGYRFGTGVAAGNLSEIAVGTAPNNLFSRALIKDNLGNPTTITVLSDEILDVTYELRVYPPITDNVFSMLLNGSSVSVTGRSYRIQDARDIFNPINAESSFTNLPAPEAMFSSTGQPDIFGAGGTWVNNGNGVRDNVVNPSYVIGSYEINCIANWGLTRANGQNQLWFLAWPHGSMSFNLAVPATKTNVKQMTLNYRISWSRYP